MLSKLRAFGNQLSFCALVNVIYLNTVLYHECIWFFLDVFYNYGFVSFVYSVVNYRIRRKLNFFLEFSEAFVTSQLL